MLPSYLAWRLVLLRTLQVTLWASADTDFVVHVCGDV